MVILKLTLLIETCMRKTVTQKYVAYEMQCNCDIILLQFDLDALLSKDSMVGLVTMLYN